MNLAITGIRLLAIYLICTGITQIPYFPLLFEGPKSDSFLVIGSSIAIVSPVIVGLFLWLISKKLARLVVTDVDVKSEIAVPDLSNQTYRLIIALAGAIIFAARFPHVVQIILRGVTTTHITERLSETYYYQLAAEVAVLLLGVWLFFGNSFWLSCFNKFKEFGLENK